MKLVESSKFKNNKEECANSNRDCVCKSKENQQE